MHSFFDALPPDEISFSRMFGALLARNPCILKTLYRRLSGKTIPKGELAAMKITVEHVDDNNRYDILCLSPSYCIVIETKINGAVVGEKQFRAYITGLSKKQRQENAFIALTDSPLQAELPAQGTFRAYTVTWREIYSLLEGKPVTIDAAEEYQKFMEENLNMNQHDIEVWAVVVRDSQKVNLNQHHVYATKGTAPRSSPSVNGTRKQAVSSYARCTPSLTSLTRRHLTLPQKPHGRASRKTTSSQAATPTSRAMPLSLRSRQRKALRTSRPQPSPSSSRSCRPRRSMCPGTMRTLCPAGNGTRLRGA